MHEIRIENLKAGLILPLDLYSAYGIKLLTRRTAITASLLKHLGELGPVLYLAENTRAFAPLAVLKEVRSEDLRRDDCARNDLVGLGGRIAARAGTVLESHHLDALADGAFEMVGGEPEHIATSRRNLTTAILERHQESWTDLDQEIPVQGDALHLDLIPDAGDWPGIAEIIAWRDERVDVLRQKYARLLAGLTVNLEPLYGLVDDLIGMLRRSPNCYAQIALLCPRVADYLPDHALSTSALAIVIAARRHWPVENIRLAGLAGLVHDVGMLLLPQRLRTEDEDLDEVDRERVMRHSAYSVALLDDVENLPETVICAAYRHHERDNGQGYPVGLRSRKIGDLARLLAVADMSAAMNEARPFRPQPLAHEAIQTLVQYGVDGLIHRPLVRSLVESVGLYPIGSYVRLSTERIALVVGMHVSAPDRPIVRICDEHGCSQGDLIDLTQNEPWELFVLDGIQPPAEEVASFRKRRAG